MVAIQLTVAVGLLLGIQYAETGLMALAVPLVGSVDLLLHIAALAASQDRAYLPVRGRQE